MNDRIINAAAIAIQLLCIIVMVATATGAFRMLFRFFAFSLLLCSIASAQQVELGSNDKATIALLESKIAFLEKENADLRSQLRARDAAKQPTPAEAKITMQSIPGCLACEVWYSTERPKLTAVGWTVDRETLTTWPAGRVFPRWRVCTGQKCVEIENCSSAQFMDRLRTWLAPQQ